MSRKRPTVLVAIKGLGIGGAERLVAEGAQHWDHDSFEYHVAYALPWKNQLVDQLEEAGVPVHLVGGERGRAFKTFVGLHYLIKRSGVSLVHAHLPSTGVIARLASSVPVVYTEHNLAASYRPISRWLNRLTYGRNRAVLAVSEEVSRSIERYPGPPVLVVPNGVTVPAAGSESDVRRDLELADGIPVIVHVGNIRPHKGHSNLIAAAARLRDLGTDAVWISIGGEKYDGDLERVRREAREAGLADSLRFLGRRDDAVRFIAEADVLVNPSDFEGMPLSVMEAMAAETPVVATAVGGVPELIKDQVTGLLVDPGDPEALARAVRRVLDYPAESRTYADAAKNLIETTYGLERMVRAQEAVYRAVLDA